MSEQRDSEGYGIRDEETRPEASPIPHSPVPPSLTTFGPCTLSNLGPGFDALGVCITGPGDRVTAYVTDTPGVTVEPGGDLPTDPATNTAARAAAHLLRQSGARGGLALRIEKGIPLGSGIGGSAASAVAGAWAANEALGLGLDKRQLVEAVLEGEAATGSRHGDNVLPALFGGAVLVDAADPSRYRRLAIPDGLRLAVLLPEVRVLTHEARAVLPKTVPHADASAQAAALAFLLDALRAGDWEAAGRAVMTDRLAEPFRAPLVPVYGVVRRAALDAGSLGCALSGSGPALFAFPDASGRAEPVLAAMRAACAASGTGATGWIADLDAEGVRTLTP
ncbi:MAG TPA: homoserine kinase [Bacteroidetes bacterium]|nr:homoserine kinase [Bacteroidota bacterium]